MSAEPTQVTAPGAPARSWKPYPAYKDPGVEWLGKVPEHWEMKKVKWIFKVINGSTPKTGNSEYWDGDITWVTPDDLGQLHSDTIYETARKITESGYKNCGTTLVPAGSLVLSTRAPIGHLAIAGTDLCTNQGCRALVFKHNDTTRYFYYQLLIARSELESWGQGSTFRELSKSKLESIELVSTQVEEQRAIARFLDDRTQKIDSLIEKKQKLIELLKEERAAVINQAVTKGLDPRAPMRDSGVEWLGEVPEHWEVKRLKYVATLKSGEFTNAENINPIGDFPVFGGNGLRGYTNTYTHEGNYILIGRQGALCGNINLVAGKFYATEHAVVVTILDKSETIWLAELLRAMNLNQYSQASAQPGLAVETIKNLFIPIPPYKDQKKIVLLINSENERINSTISKIENEVSLLQEYRTALISEVVTGKIDVRGECETEHGARG